MAAGFRIAQAFVEIEAEDNTHRGLSRIGTTVARWGSKLAEGITKWLGQGAEEGTQTAASFFNQFFKNTTSAAMSMATNVGTAIAGAVTSEAALTAGTGGINLLVSALLAVAGAAAVAAAGFVALAPVVLLAGGAVGALFTAIAGGAASIAVFKLGLSGVSDALGEVSEKGKASNETLKKLSPNARAFVKAFEGIQKPLKALKTAVQDHLFAGMAESFKTLAQRWLPALKPMLTGLADVFSDIGRKAFDALGKPDFIKNIQTAVAGFGGMLSKIGASFPSLIDAFGRLAAASVPFLDKIGELVGGLITKFGDWIKKMDESGKLGEFMKQAAQALQDVWDIGGLVFGIIGDIVKILFPGSKRESDSFLGGVKGFLEGIKSWLDNPDNQQKVRDWIQKFQDFVDKVRNEWIPKAIEWAEKIGGWISKVTEWIDKIKGIKDTIVNTWDEIKTWTENKWNAIVEFFTGLPGRIIGAITALPGQVAGVVSSMATQALYWIGYMIGSAIGTLLTLPGRAASAIASLPGVISNIFTNAKNTAVNLASSLLSSAVSFFSQLPGRVSGALSALPGLVSSAFNSAKNAAVNTASSMVSSAIGVIQRIPGMAASALSGLGGVLVGAGRALIQGLIDGISAKIPSLKGLLSSVTNLIPSWKGPMDRDKKLLQPAGAAIMGGLMRGIDSQTPALRDQLQGLTGQIGSLGATIGRGGATGGQTIHIEKIVLDASGMKDINDLITMVQGVTKTARQYSARGRVATPAGGLV